MAKKRRPSDSNQDDLSREDFGPSPEAHPDARAFTGYLRQAPDGTNWRLYLNLDFNDYLEIPAAAIIDQRTLASRSNPLAGNVVWIRAAAVLRRVQVNVREAQAEFLRGEIVSQNLSLASTDIVPMGTTTNTVGPSWNRPCLSEGPKCPPPAQTVYLCPTRYFCPQTVYNC